MFDLRLRKLNQKENELIMRMIIWKSDLLKRSRWMDGCVKTPDQNHLIQGHRLRVCVEYSSEYSGQGVWF